MKKFALLGLALASAISLGGCATAVQSGPYPYPPVVVGGPDSVVIDYWYDGSVYYYYDANLGQYFFYDGAGIREYCGRGWLPQAGWHRHDGGWRADAGWGRGHGGGHFPGDGGPFPGGGHFPGDGGPFPGGGHFPGDGGPFPGGGHFPGDGGHFPGGGHEGRHIE